MKKIILSFVVLVNLVYADLTKQDYKEIKKLIAMVESKSKGDLTAENSRGFLGRYQFGSSALVDVKLVKRDRYIRATFISREGSKQKVVWRNGLTQKTFLANPSNWTIKGGKKAFLASEALQERAMDQLLAMNYKKVIKAGVNPNDKQTLKGLLMAAHLGGVKNALAYAKNKVEFRDAFGTKISKYYKIGTLSTGKNVGALAKKYLGGKYTWGGTTPSKGMDCSGYTQFIYKKIGVNLPRTAYQQYKWRGGVPVRDGLKKGDLLFFNTDKKRGIPITHVGVYLEDGKFIHAASTKKGIIISSLSGYYKKVFKGAKRIIRDDKAKSVRYAKGFTQTKPLVFPKNFFKPTLENALISQTKIAMNMDPLVIYNGVYMRQSQVNKLKGN